jgi:hypothetical protein
VLVTLVVIEFIALTALVIERNRHIDEIADLQATVEQQTREMNKLKDKLEKKTPWRADSVTDE